MNKIIKLNLVAIVAVLLGMPVMAAADGGRTYEVSVTNVTRGQILSPIVVATHSGALEPLFVLGEPASSELAMVAEDAVLDPMVAALESNDAVGDVQILTGEVGPILPGETAIVKIKAKGKFRRVTLIGMLVTTNDAFVALDGVLGPRSQAVEFDVLAYDAGSEGNNENCEFIPGPPCDNPGVREEIEAEGYVHIHAGVHGIADLVPDQHDWRNPAAHVRISRRHGDD